MLKAKVFVDKLDVWEVNGFVFYGGTDECVLSFHLFWTLAYTFPEFVGASAGVNYTGGRSQLQTGILCVRVCCGNNTQPRCVACCVLHCTSTLFVRLFGG